MRKAKHRRMHVRRSVYANRYVKKTGVNLYAVIVIIGLAVALGFLTTKYVVYPLILGQEASFDVVLGKIGFGGDKDDDKNSGTESEESNLDDSKSTDNSADIDNNSGANIAIPTTEAYKRSGSRRQHRRAAPYIRVYDTVWQFFKRRCRGRAFK